MQVTVTSTARSQQHMEHVSNLWRSALSPERDTTNYVNRLYHIPQQLFFLHTCSIVLHAYIWNVLPFSLFICYSVVLLWTPYLLRFTERRILEINRFISVNSRLKSIKIKLKYNLQLYMYCVLPVNLLNAELNPICYLLALLAHHFLHVSRIRVKSLTLRLLMSYTYIYI